MSHPFEDRAAGAPEAEVLGYGGSAGGGKTDALLVAGIVTGLTWPGCHVGVFRRTYPELEGPAGVVERSHDLLSGWAHWDAGHRRWVLPGGSMLQFCHVHREADVYRYQSTQFDALLVDEATHLTEFQMQYLRTRNRATVDGARPFAACASNPGNVGHLWFKRAFLDPGAPEQAHSVQVEGTAISHEFIPARLRDNRILERRDPGYRRRLEAQPKNIQRALLDGDWDVFVGQVLTEWSRDIHVVRPFLIPEEWPRWRAVDWGYAAPWCCLWLAQDPETGQRAVYRELYRAGLTDPEQAEMIRQTTGAGERVLDTLADPSMWAAKTTGARTTTTAEVYRKGGVPLRKADNDRIGGLRRVRDALAVGPRGAAERKMPGVVVFETCANLIRTLPALVYDPVVVEDVNSDGEDHAYDALRYGLSYKAVRRREPKAGRDVWAGARR
jgi:hypothetical protein